MSDSRLPRRDFLATGMGLAAAALTTGRAGAVSPNDKINLGIIGCGVRGTYILSEAMAAGAGKVNVVGVCDVWSMARDKMATALAEKQGGQRPKEFTRYHDLLAMPGLDAVIITTPDHAHCPVLIDTVKAGKDAYVEKPLCARLEDAWAAHDVVKAAPDRIVQVGTQRRSSRKFQAALDYVKTGALGPVCKIETAWNRNVPSWKRPVDMVKAGGRGLAAVPDVPAGRAVRSGEVPLLAAVLRAHDGAGGAARQPHDRRRAVVHGRSDPELRRRARRRPQLEGRPRDQRHRGVRLRVPEGVDPDVLVAARVGARDRLRGVLRQGADARLARLDQPPGEQQAPGGRGGLPGADSGRRAPGR